MFLGVVVFFCASCVVEAAEPSPQEVHTGAYEVTVTTAMDSCEPARLEGERGISDVFVYEDGAEVAPMVPTESTVLEEGFARQVLKVEDRYTKVMGRGDVVGGECGAEAIYLTRLSVAGVDEGGLTVRRWTEWKVVTPCEEGREALSPEIPRESCSVKQDIRYELVKACDAPCKLWNRGEGKYDCECE